MAQSELQQAIAAIKSGNNQTGQRILHQLLGTEPDNEAALLWLASIEDNEAKKLHYLKQVLELNLKSEEAREALTRLGTDNPPLPLITDIVPSLKKITPSQEIEQAEIQQRRKWFRIAVIPFCILFLFFCFLWLINSEYIERMIYPCAYRGISMAICSQPAGWIMSLLGIGLPIVGLLLVVGLDSWLPPEREGIRVIAATLYVFFIVLPAMLIILLGPAILVIMETPGFGF